MMLSRTGLLLILISAFICVPSSGAAEDRLADAMRALEADSFTAALELSSALQPNQWLDIYRLSLRAESFLGTEDSTSSAERAVSALRLISGEGAKGHPLEGGLIDLAVRCSGPEIILPFLTGRISSRLRPETLLLIGRHYLETGDSTAAAAAITLASGRRPRIHDMELLNELAVSGALTAPGISSETVASLASAAIYSGDKETSQLLIDLIRSAGEYRWLAELLDADLLAASGRKTRALTRYRAVFNSEIYPVEGKKQALQRLAGLQYRMKRYRDASTSYRTYGLCYPADPLAEMSTDMSARLEVASGQWEAAAATWSRIADAGPGSLIGREAILGMAVVLEKTGRKSEAYKALVDNLPGIRGRLRAAYLYWIIRTCGDEQSRSDHAVILEGQAAWSFYAIAMGDGPGFLNADDERNSVPSIRELESDSRKLPFPGSGVPLDHPALGAFRYFASEEMKGEAAVCLRGYIESLDDTGKKECVGSLYDEARKSGLESLCLELAVEYDGLFAGRKDYIEFLYPVAYGSEIDLYSKERELPPELVLAVIREESRFDEAVESPAGAWGLMQVMPSTGDWIGGKLGMKDVTLSDLRDPGFNISAGCWYLRFLLDRADESLVAALAAYNAGHGRMRSWKKKFSPHRDPLAAIELIGPSETRQYVRRVLDTMAAYNRQSSTGRQ